MEEDFNIREIVTKHSNLLVSNDRQIGDFDFRRSSSLSSSPSSPIAENINNTLDLGYVKFFDLPLAETVPLGYEDDESNNYNDRKLVINNVELLFKCKQNYSKSCIVTDVQIYPNYDSSKLSIYDDNDEENDNLSGSEITSEKPFKFNLEFIFKFRKDAEFIGRWIIFTIKQKSKLDPLTSISSTLLVGLKVIGTVVSENIEKKLNVEAKPFVPKSMLIYFDEHVPVYPVTTILLNEKLGVMPPVNWSNLLNLLGINPIFPPGYDYLPDTPPPIKTEYNRILSSNNLQNIKVLFNNYLTDKKFDKNSKYIESLRICSWMEEIQTFIDIGQYDDISIKIDFKPAPFDSLPPGFSLLQTTIKKKGSSEGRPKIVAGDFIRIRPTMQSITQLSMTSFELLGNITSYSLKSEEYNVLFVLPNFISTPPYNQDQMKMYCEQLSKLEYNIRYTSDSLGFLLQRRALNKSRVDVMMQSLMFPKSSMKVEVKSRVDVRLETTVDFNEEQIYAIETISLLADDSNYRCYSREQEREIEERLPIFIIYGPPGTGKTSTICETMRNITSIYTNTKTILATAPSDAAADVICLRLTKFLNPGQLLRLNYFKRIDSSVPAQLKGYCYSKDNTNIYDIPSIDVLKSFNVIVTTCATAGALDVIGITFDVIFIDEASQATEIDCLIPVTLATKNSVVVIAGDPEQLRATNRSPAFDILSKNESLQERLLNCDMYSNVIERAKQKNHSSLFLNKASSIIDESGALSLGVYLTKNYRSHSSLFELSSRLFYHHSLEEMGKKESTCKFLDFEMLPKEKHFGCIFIGVAGNHQHELDSPSFYNISELSKTLEVCKALLTSTSIKVSAKDIGIICAFRSQVLKLRILLRSEGMSSINVGSVEDFQGQETSIIIISTVLSSKVNQWEIKNSIGLMNDHRKFNVSVTRGASMCICIGNPYMLATDVNWSEYMNYCDQNSSYFGVRLRQSQDDIVIATLLGSSVNDSKNATISYYSDMPFYSIM